MIQTSSLRFFRTLFCLISVCSLALTFPFTASAFWDRKYDNLSELSGAVAKEISSSFAGAKLYLDKEHIRETVSGDTFAFSARLANELERALANEKFTLVPSFMANADYAVSVEFQRDGAEVRLFIKLVDTRGADLMKPLAGQYVIASDKIPTDSFTENLDTMLHRVVLRVIRKQEGLGGLASLRTFIKPVVEESKKQSSQFAVFATGKIKTILASSWSFTLLDEKPSLAKIASTQVSSSLPEAAITGADAILEGTYQKTGDAVQLNITLKNKANAVIARESISIPRSFITHRLDDEQADYIAAIADSKHEKGDPSLRFFTTKAGGTYQSFKVGEVIQLAIQLPKPMFVYLYNIDPKGEVELLYPRSDDEERKLVPNKIHTFPDIHEPWSLKAAPPFGTDAVKLFATERPISQPKIDASALSRSFQGQVRVTDRTGAVAKELAVKQSINGLDVVDWFRGKAESIGIRLYEATAFVEILEK